MNFENLMAYIVRRLREPSTWRGAIAMLTSAGLAIEPEQATAIITAGVGVMGLIGLFTPDSREEKQ